MMLWQTPRLLPTMFIPPAYGALDLIRSPRTQDHVSQSYYTSHPSETLKLSEIKALLHGDLATISVP